VPIAGAWFVRELFVSTGAAAKQGTLTGIDLSVAENAVASAEELYAAEACFPFGASVVRGHGKIYIGHRFDTPRVSLERGVVFDGRRLVCGLYSGDSAITDWFVGVVADELERMPVEAVGGSAGGGIMGQLSAAAAAARGS
jgi:hypothetical protein